jgi:hypothetical protein
MPFLMSLGNQFGIATHYYADMHNSISALMHLTAGQTVTTDDSTPDTFDVDNIVRRLTLKGLTFRSYQQGLPDAGFLGLWSGHYVKRHNPLAYFSDVADSSLRYNLVPMPQLDSDLANHGTANFNYVTPDLDNDAHDGSMQAADEWLRKNLPSILAQPEFQPGSDGLLFVVFDEGNLGKNIDFRCDAHRSDKSCGGRVLTVVIGPNVRSGFQSGTFYNHESLLATVCQALGTDGCPGRAAKAATMADFFVTPLSAVPGTAMASPGHPAQYSLTVMPVNGFYGAEVQFSCGKLPGAAECSFSPPTIQLGSDGATSTLTVSIPAQSANLRRSLRSGPGPELALWLGLPGLVLRPTSTRRRRLALATMAVFVVFLFCMGCGAGPAAPGANRASTPASGQNYTLNVTAQSSSASFTVPVTLQVGN